MPTLYMMKGLPASGKTTHAKEMQAKSENIKCVSRDNLRLMLDNGKYNKENEKFVLHLRNMIISNALMAGYDVICDDTNLAPKHEEHLNLLAAGVGAEFEIKDFTHVSLEECITRDKKRQNYVGEKVIRQMWRQYLAPKIEPVVFDAGLPNCYIFDLDGTLAIMNGRGPFEWDKVNTDIQNYPICGIYRILRDYSKREFNIDDRKRFIILSGRNEICRQDTIAWLGNNGINYDYLFMRKQDDIRDDTIVKKELYEHHIDGKFNVVAIFDDRSKVVDTWRSLGLTALQVAEGNF